MKSVTNRLTTGCEWALRQPLLWGGMACLAFYALAVDRFDPEGRTYHFFREGHWAWKAAVCTLFATGAIQLVIRLMGLVVEMGAVGHHSLPKADGLELGGDVDSLLAELDKAPRGLQNGYLMRRLRVALEWVKLRDSADGLDGVLGRIAVDDRHRMHDRDAASRAVAFASILIGAIGALIGISAALAMTADAPDATTLPQVLAGVATALEPLVLALGLTLLLWLGKFTVASYELNLLAEVDRAVDHELLGRFRRYGFDGDPHSASIAKMSEKVLQTVATSAQQHDQALAKALAQTGRRWEEMATSASNLLQRRTPGGAITSGLKEHSQALSDSVAKFAHELDGVLVRHAEILNSGVEHHTAELADALEHHAAVLAAAEHGLAEENRRHLTEVEASLGESILIASARQEKLIHQSERILEELQVALVEAAGTAVAQQEQLVKHTDVLLKVIEAAGQIRTMEEALNSNLSALASSQSFEEAASTLSAAVQLLSSRLGRPAVLRSDLGLGGDHTTSHAA